MPSARHNRKEQPAPANLTGAQPPLPAPAQFRANLIDSLRPTYNCTANPYIVEIPRMPVIQATGLTKTYRVFQKKEGLLGAIRGLLRREYRQVQAVDGVSFSIEPGEMVGFLGPNGAGKTTTLKMLSGLIYPTSGTAQVLGFIPWERADT